jgi:DNA polymerase-3 subunit beta
MTAATEQAATPKSGAKSAITLSNLKHALKVVSAAVDAKTTIPVLSCVRIEQQDAGLAIEASNLDLSIRTIMQELGGPAAPIVIPADKLTAWAKLLDGDDVTISATDSRATVKCGRARAVLPVLAASNWPQCDAFKLDVDGITLTQGDFARALGFALGSVSNEEGRFTLNGVQIEGDGTSLKFVSTNGHSMTVYTIPSAEKINLLAPTRLIKAFLPLLTDENGGFDLYFNDKAILAKIDGDTKVLMASPRMAGTFPKWQMVLPKTEDRAVVTVNAAEMLGSVERAALLADDTCRVVLNFSPDDDHITIEASSSQAGESEEYVTCSGRAEKVLKIGANPAYLINLCKRITGEIRIVLPKDNGSALLFHAQPHEGESVEYVVMPMRV